MVTIEKQRVIISLDYKPETGGCVNVVYQTRYVEDGVVIDRGKKESYSYSPGDDDNGKLTDEEVLAFVAPHWTEDVKAAYAAKIVSLEKLV